MKSLDSRYVTHFDMLGMKSTIMRNTEQAWNVLCNLANAKDRILNLNIEIVASREKIRDRVRAFTFSDTIVLFTLSDEVQDIYAMTMLASQLFAFSLASCVHLRGGIAHGDFFFNEQKNLFLGKPLVEAYILSEEAHWLGITISSKVADDIRAVPLQSGNIPKKPTVIEWDVPVKHGESKNRTIINWPEIFRKNFKVNHPISVEQFYAAFIPLFGDYHTLPLDVKQKYVNTVEFINRQLT